MHCTLQCSAVPWDPTRFERSHTRWADDGGRLCGLAQDGGVAVWMNMEYW